MRPDKRGFGLDSHQKNRILYLFYYFLNFIVYICSVYSRYVGQAEIEGLLLMYNEITTHCRKQLLKNT